MCKCEDSGFFRFFTSLLFGCNELLAFFFFFVCRSSWWMLLKMALRKAQAKGWWRRRWRQKAGGLKSCWREERGRGHTVCNERRREKKTLVRTLISGKSVLNRGSKKESFSLFFEFKIVWGGGGFCFGSLKDK